MPKPTFFRPGFGRAALVAAAIMTAGPLVIAAERATVAPPQFNLTCLAPILNTVDPDAPVDLGQAFLFGPWHQPELRDDLGKVSFPLSSAEDELQAVFNQGIAALHLFWYGEAERCFRSAATIDPKHPMPYWGLALANERHPQRAAFFAAEAERRSHNRADLSGIERDWLQAIVGYYRGVEAGKGKPAAIPTAAQWSERRRSLVRGLERMAFKYPDNREVAAALLRRVILGHHQAGDPIASHFANNLLADRLAVLGPDHPSRHYRLFLWLGQDPRLAVPAAATAPLVAPGVPHSWRYPAETFRAAGRLPEAVELGARAMRVAHREMERRGEPMPDRIEDLVRHYEAYITDLTATGQFEKARATARQLIGLPRTFYREKRHTHAQRLAGSYFTGRRLLGQLHIRLELWQDLLAECESGSLVPLADDPLTKIESLFWRGIAHCNLGQTEQAAGMVKEMTTGLRAAKGKGITSETEEFMVHLARTVRTHAEYSSGKRNRLPDKEVDVTYLPADHLARLYFAAGLQSEGLALIDAEFAARSGEFLATAGYCDLQHRAGNARQALYAFNKSFRANASLAFGQLPVLRRLDAVAAAMRLGSGWRLPAPTVDALAVLPPGDELGPPSWAPAAAPGFSLPDASGTEITQEDFAGKPVVLNFFLGAGCAFCRQQMDLFTPVLPAYEEAGIAFVGITTDPLRVLQTVLEAQKINVPGGAPLYAFPVLCDPRGSAFAAFGAFEGFETRPIHGTILLDGSGRVLWRDIGHEPFNHPIQLLREAERLLEIHAPRKASAQQPPSPNNP